MLRQEVRAACIIAGSRLNFALHGESLFKEATRRRINRHPRTKSRGGWTCSSLARLCTHTHTRRLLMGNTYYAAKVALADVFYKPVSDTSRFGPRWILTRRHFLIWEQTLRADGAARNVDSWKQSGCLCRFICQFTK